MPRAAMRQANLFATNGQDVQNLFVGTRVVVNFRVARHSGNDRNGDCAQIGNGFLMDLV